MFHVCVLWRVILQSSSFLVVESCGLGLMKGHNKDDKKKAEIISISVDMRKWIWLAGLSCCLDLTKFSDQNYV